MNPQDPDVVIIGSGFGGSISANRLALAGLKVLVLERGPWRDSLPVRSMGIERRAPFPYGMKVLSHALRTIHVGRWHLTLNKSGMFEVFSYPGLGVITVSAVGGGSHGWAGMLVPPQNPGYWTGRHPDLKPGQIEVYYDKVRADMGAVRLSQDQWLRQSIWTHLPASSGCRCLPAEQQPHMALKVPYSEGEVGQVTEGVGGVKRQTCAFNGDSFLGSRGGAKASVDFIYLAPVLNKGAAVRDMCEVTKITRDKVVGGSGYAVHFSSLRDGRKEIVRTKRVILAAGTMNTLRLLFASSAKPGGLNPMPSLGRTFGGNGDLLGAWFKNSAQPPTFDSTPVLGRFKVDGQDTPFVVLAGLPGFDTLPLPRGIKKKLANTALAIGMGADTGKASVSFKKGRLQVDYDPAQQPVFETIRQTMRALEAESGMKTWTIKKPITVHQWGGACLGPDCDRGVVDHKGEVYGNPGLFIADAAALPAGAWDAAVTHDFGMGAPCRRPPRANGHLKFQKSASLLFQGRKIITRHNIKPNLHAIKKFLKEPLVHFLLLGALLFGVFAWLNRGASARQGTDADTVRITTNEVAWLANSWTIQRQTPPTREQLSGLVTEYLKEELLAREARAMGLDQDDLVVRRRLAQKLQFLVQDTSQRAEPTDEDLRRIYEAHPDQFQIKEHISFTQVFFNHDTRNDAAADARAALAELNHSPPGTLPAGLGDRLPLEAEVVNEDEQTVAGQFGDPFAKAVFALKPGAWQGPIESAYGLHLVRVSDVQPAKRREFAEVKAQILYDWHDQRQREDEDKYYAALLKKYPVVVDESVKPFVGPLTGPMAGQVDPSGGDIVK